MIISAGSWLVLRTGNAVKPFVASRAGPSTFALSGICNRQRLFWLRHLPASLPWGGNGCSLPCARLTPQGENERAGLPGRAMSGRRTVWPVRSSVALTVRRHYLASRQPGDLVSRNLVTRNSGVRERRPLAFRLRKTEKMRQNAGAAPGSGMFEDNGHAHKKAFYQRRALAL